LAGDVNTLKQQRAHLKEAIRNGREEFQAVQDDGTSTAAKSDKQSSLKDQTVEKNNPANSLLEEELEQLRKTLASQDAALVELRAKLNDERNRSVQLEEDKSELESMLTGNTLEHLMRSKASGHWRPNSQSETTSSISSRSQDDTTDATSEGLRPLDEEARNAERMSLSDVTATPKPRTRRSSSLQGEEEDTVDEGGSE
jgi:chromosome segregation ATPase